MSKVKIRLENFPADLQPELNKRLAAVGCAVDGDIISCDVTISDEPGRLVLELLDEAA
jgi:hypothetical protein